ncbi:MAG TPA: gliding motility-associated ABC transporter ATP-binding subunit GldA, partial [Chitinophagaceae bacterium]|nr:gliding motility-associated ABC transporter ATP-binding subunit GldA [Chitinophagaceae bacterium]
CDRVIIIDKGEIVADDKLSNLQKGGRDKHVVKVKFKDAIDKSLLQKINGVMIAEGIESTSHEKSTSYRIETEDPEAVRRQILELSLENNLNIVSLQSDNQSLEEVFRSLTQSGIGS